MWTWAEHQEEAVFMMDCNPALAVWAEAGCGKTLITLRWAYHALADGRIDSILVVCPAPMVGVWRSAPRDLLNFEGYTEEGVDALSRALSVISFQRVYVRVKRTVHHRDGVDEQKVRYALRDEVDRRWGAVVVDESHCIGTHGSRQTNACLTLSRLAKHRYLLSGTPTYGGGGQEDFSKLYGQIKFLDHDVWTSWSDFCRKCVKEFDYWGKPKKYDLDLCHALMFKHGIVYRLCECFDMPDRTEEVIPCDVAEKKVYNDIVKHNVEEYGLDITVSGGEYIKLLQICSGFLKTVDGVRQYRTSKDEALRVILEGTTGKVVVFCNFTASVDRVKSICEDVYKGSRIAVFDGRSSTDTWKELQYGDARVLVCQYQSGGVGLDLYASSTMVLWEPCLSSLLLEQTKARIFRKGQTAKCRYLYLSTPGTIEERVWGTVKSGVDVTRDMLDGWARCAL